MKMKHVGMAGMAALAALGGVALGGVVPAQASIFGCPTSTVCLYQGNYYGPAEQQISGYNVYTDVNSQQYDQTSSWINACNSQGISLGEWRSGKMFNGQYLPAGWVEDLLGAHANFDNKADYVAQSGPV